MHYVMTRTRSKTTPGQSGFHRIIQGGVLTVNDELHHDAESLTTVDEVVPSFWKRSRKGEVFINPYSNTLTQRTFSGSYRNLNVESGELHEWTNGTLFRYFFGPDLGINEVGGIDTLHHIDKAKIDALGQVNGIEINAPVFAAEWKQTKRLHKDVIDGLHNVVKAARHKNSSLTSYKLLKSVANLWLLRRYGILPLISDLQAAVKVLNQRMSPRYTGRGSSTQTVVTEDTLSLGDTPCTWYVSKQTEYTFTARAGVLYESNELMHYAGNIGLTRPLSAAYELARFSFVLDWLVDVGGWLDAIQPQPGAKTLGAWITTETKKSVILSVTGNSGMGSLFAASWGGTASVVTRNKTRVPWNAVPPLTPVLGTGLNLIRSLDAAALLQQRLKIKK